MEQYRETVQEVLQKVGGTEAGLTEEEASRRLARFGRNELQDEKRASKLGLFFSQFKDLMTLILISAAFLSGVLAFVTGEKSELADTAILLFVILLNAVVGFLQEYRADAAIANLKKLSADEANVVRGGRVLRLPAAELVVGDVVELEEGDRVPADCRILSSSEFRCDESALTGESAPVKKRDCVVASSALAERANTAHMGTFCVKGSARLVVVSTGMDTEMGKIASLLKEEKPAPSPLDKTIAKLGKIVTVSVLLVAAVLFLGGLFSRRVGFLQNVMNAVAVAVAAIPEGMGAVVTVILAMGVQRMAKARAVVRKLSAVEALGSCSVICSDKTGTLTKNKMTVEALLCDLAGESPRAREEALKCMRVCNTVKGERGGYLGDPTEIALVEYADLCNVPPAPRVLQLVPFSSERRRMSVRTAEGSYEKGGAEVLLPLCRRVYSENREIPLTEGIRKDVLARARECAGRGMRVLALAKGEEGELTLLALVALHDPPREGAEEAVASCRRAGVKTVMITGDSRETAFSVAARLGIARNPSEVLTGEEMDALGEEYFPRAKRYSVYARVSPRHKSEIVKALKRSGEVVAMTGDGVNDAPALRAADIGVAMGSGTDVTKNAADMVLTDDDFSTMVHAVEEGRNVFFNIKKTISFFLSTNLAEVLCVLFASLLLWRYHFLTSTQLLWINLITDSLPVLALGVEKSGRAMERPPVSDREIFSPPALCRMALYGLVQTGIVLGLFLFGLKFWGNAEASTAAFLAMSFTELLHAFNVRAEEGKPFSNPVLLATAAVGALLNVLIAVVPIFCRAFSLAPLLPAQWAAVGIASFGILLFGAAERAARGLKRRKRRTLSPESTR